MSNGINLSDFEPSWRGYPRVPSRISDGSINSQGSEAVTSPPSSIKEVSSGSLPMPESAGKVSSSAETLGSFIASYNYDTGKMSIGPGSYQYPIGSNVDVAETGEEVGRYAYAVIKQSAGGGLDTFSIEITNATKDPTNLDAGNTFVEFSNVLLAEIVGSGDAATLAQRRVGNLSLIYRVINGSLCLWPETTGGTSP